MNEYLLLVIYVLGVVYSAFGYGVVIGEWDFDWKILLIFMWPLAMLVAPVLALILPFYVLGTKCFDCIIHCEKRRKLRQALPPISWRQWCLSWVTDCICYPCICLSLKVYSCCRRKHIDDPAFQNKVSTLNSDPRIPKLKYKPIENISSSSSSLT
jgi:hypothetical protein